MPAVDPGEAAGAQWGRDEAGGPGAEVPTRFVEDAVGTPIFRLILQFLAADALVALARCRPSLRGEVQAADQAWEALLRLRFGGSYASAGRLCPEARSPCQAFAALAALSLAVGAVEVLEGDLADAAGLGVEAVVCPAVPSLEPYGPAARAVHQAAGWELREHIRASLQGPLEVGQAFWTPGFRLGTEGIVHAVGPTARTADRDRKLHEVYAAALQKVEEQGYSSVALGSISTGGNGVEGRLASQVALEEIRRALARRGPGRALRIVVLTFTEQLESHFKAAVEKASGRVNEDLLEMLPLIVHEPMLPRQALRFEDRELVCALRPEGERLAMIGRRALDHEGFDAPCGVEVRVRSRSSAGGTTRFEVVAGRRFRLPGGLSCEAAPDEQDRPYCSVSVEWVCEAEEEALARAAGPRGSEAAELERAGPEEQQEALVEQWLALVRAGRERQPGQLDRILEQLGPMPPPESPVDRSFWVAALINPLPALGVAREIRDRVLHARTHAARVLEVHQALLDSIDGMTA